MQQIGLVNKFMALGTAEGLNIYIKPIVTILYEVFVGQFSCKVGIWPAFGNAEGAPEDLKFGPESGVRRNSGSSERAKVVLEKRFTECYEFSRVGRSEDRQDSKPLYLFPLATL